MAARPCTLQVRLVPRFGVLQGVRADGTPKVRAVDNFSWSCSGRSRTKRKRSEIKSESVNGHFAFEQPISHDHLDDIFEAMRLQHAANGEVHLCLYAWSSRPCESFLP
jgi:hypothetical protein